jgi:hypothetical protein
MPAAPSNAQSSNAFAEKRPQVEDLGEEDSSNHRPSLSVNEQKEIDKMFSGLDDDFATSLSMHEASQEAVRSGFANIWSFLLTNSMCMYVNNMNDACFSTG